MISPLPDDARAALEAAIKAFDGHSGYGEYLWQAAMAYRQRRDAALCDAVAAQYDEAGDDIEAFLCRTLALKITETTP